MNDQWEGNEILFNEENVPCIMILKNRNYVYFISISGISSLSSPGQRRLQEYNNELQGLEDSEKDFL